MPPLLERLNLPRGAQRQVDLTTAAFICQESFSTVQGSRRPDAEIRIGDIRIVVEAKVGRNSLDQRQLRAYAENLRNQRAAVKRLICITQANDRAIFDAIRKTIEPAILANGSMICIRWYEVLDIIKRQVGLDDQSYRKVAKRISQGRRVPYEARLSTLFLEEVQRDMYDKRLIDEIPTNELPDIVLSSQTSWYMRAAMKFHVWFPKGGVGNPTPAKYVAYYEICDGKNHNPKEIRLIARNRIWWNHLTLEDAMREEELKVIFRDKQMKDEMITWTTFNIVLTDVPVQLTRPVKLGSKTWAARLLPLRKSPLPEFLNAITIDDLYTD